MHSQNQLESDILPGNQPKSHIIYKNQPNSKSEPREKSQSIVSEKRCKYCLVNIMNIIESYIETLF